MIKKIINILKAIVISFLLLYGYNLIVSNTNFYIPINFYTVILITIFGVPALFALILISLIVF